MNAAVRQIVAGQLSEFDLATLLHTFSACRQVIALEILTASGQVTGRIVLKSGKVVAATAGLVTGAQALQKLMTPGAQARFRVFNEGAALSQDVVPLGSIHELVGKPGSRSGRHARTRIPMMEGSLAEFDIATIMQVACLGRQYTELDVLGPNRSPVGTICLKGGKIESARAGTMEGIAAIHHLLDTPGSYEFTLYRTPPGDRVGEPLGSVRDILMRITERGSGKPTARPAPSRPTARAAPTRAKGGTLMMGGPVMEEEAPTAQRKSLSTPARVRIMEGVLSDFDVPSLLQGVNLGRQHVVLEVLDGERLIGSVSVKAGMVLRATAGHLEGTAAVQRLVESSPSCQFVMWRVPGGVEGVEPIGTVGSTLLRAVTASALAAKANGALPSTIPPPRHAAIAPSRIPVMDGSLSDFDLQTVLATIGMMRQHTELEVRTGEGLLGAVHLRSGMVLHATAGGLDGGAAVRALLDAPKTARFFVCRTPGERDEVEPLGPLHLVLGRALARPEPPPRAVEVPRAFVPPPREQAPAPVVAPPRRRNHRWLVVALAAAGALAAAVVLRIEYVDHGSSADTASVRPASPVGSPTVAAASPAVTQPPARPTSSALADGPATAGQQLPTIGAWGRGPEVLAAQTALKGLGFDPGPIDGVLGPRTEGAIRAFQRAEHVAVDGVLTGETRTVLAARAHNDGVR